LFKNRVSIAEIVTVICNEKMIMNGECRSTWKDIQCFKTFSWLLAEETENPKRPKSRQPVLHPGFKPEPTKIQVRSIAVTLTCLVEC
jgi:hypothetical protein